jgi:hypothetical protein
MARRTGYTLPRLVDEIAKMMTRDLDEDQKGRPLAMTHLDLKVGFV